MEELLAYYSNLLIIQYNNKPRAKATIELLTYLIFANLVFQQIQNAFDWKTAVGEQLEIIGKWLGVSKDYQGSLFWGNTYFSYPNTNNLLANPQETDTLQHGYSTYSTFNTDTGNVLTYDNIGFVDQELNPEDYRTVIGLKIIKNSINHTAKNIDDAIWEYFGGQTLYSNQSISVGTKLYTNPDLSGAYSIVTNTTNGIEIALNAEAFNNNNWNIINTGFGKCKSIAYGNNKYIAVSSIGNILSSTNGITWTTAGQVNINLDKVIYANNKFIAIGHSNSNYGYITTSTNGTTWTTPARMYPDGVGMPQGVFTGLAYGKNTYAAIGFNLYATSSNGTDWIIIQQNRSCKDIIFANNKFVAVGNSGIMYSSTGSNWSSLINLDNVRWQSITYGNNKFIAVGYKTGTNYGYITTSTNGETWTTPIKIMDIGAYTVTYGNGVYLVAGKSGNSVYSTDGINWSSPQLINDINWNCSIHAQNKFLLGGDNGNIATSYDFSSIGEKNLNYYNSVEIESNLYKISIGNIYTTWSANQITYHYPESMETLINVCNYKNVLPAPIGTKIVLSQIS